MENFQTIANSSTYKNSGSVENLDYNKIGLGLRAFLSNLSNAKNLIFLAFSTQKLAPSNALNGIIFAIDEQCNLIFETALFTNCKPYIIFLFNGPTKEK